MKESVKPSPETVMEKQHEQQQQHE
eukprot:SAG11_NODE_35169_length_268_cov_0.603550_1_plen_24_part_10